MTVRLAYLSGPVDAIKVYETWSRGGRHDYFGTSYLSQFFEVCSAIDADGYVVTTLSAGYSRRQIGRIVFENRPPPSEKKGGLLYHWAAVAWFARFVPSLLHFRPQTCIVTALQNYWFLLFVVRWWGVEILPALHCALWPKFVQIRLSWRILLRLNALFFRHSVRAALVASDDIAAQIQSLLGQSSLRTLTFLPTYEEQQFQSISPADPVKTPFTILFAGRIEANKGIYDLVNVALRLHERQPGRFQFDVCGEGSELAAFRRLVADRGLKGMIDCHGFCERSRFLYFLNRAHAVIVPTTSQFEEGFAMICAEAVLAGRPVITSAVCPALASIREAAVEVPPDDVDGYCKAILRLSRDLRFYERKRRGARALQPQFYDLANSWGAKLQEALGLLGPTLSVH